MQLSFRSEPVERLLHELLAVIEVVEYALLEHHVPTVDPHACVVHRADARHRSRVVELDDVERSCRRHSGQGCDRLASAVLVDDVVQRRIDETVGVVREKRTAAGEMAADASKALPDQRMQAGVDERDAPVLHVTREHLHVVAAALEHEVIRQPLLVLEEILLDLTCAIAETQDEVVVAMVRVVLHDVPQQGSGSDGHQRFRNTLVVVAHAHALTAAEDDHLHGRPPRRPSSSGSPRRTVRPTRGCTPAAH